MTGLHPRAIQIVAAVGAAWLVLSIPDCAAPLPPSPDATPFVWNRGSQWADLESRFQAARSRGCPDHGDLSAAKVDQLLRGLSAERADPEDARWEQVLDLMFDATAAAAGCGAEPAALERLHLAIRKQAKAASVTWPAATGRPRLYQLIYGARAAMEEMWLQRPESKANSLTRFDGPDARTPFVTIDGVKLHSGDLLLSRGGAPTSAFIARGNNYPGNFSHVALAHVSESDQLTIIESHIERGVVISTGDEYLADKKLRILVLRLRDDHPALMDHPLLPHRAASAARDGAQQRHIPYDFAMDFHDPSAQFCSEVASQAYRSVGVELWQNLSSFSGPGLARWMAAFGVEHLETQAPSDLEYDPQLRVVAEWHDPATLFEDHIDSAVIDAMLEQADDGANVEHSRILVPVARLAKATSVALNLMGKVGPVPEGMSATVGLRARWLRERHAEIRGAVLTRATAFEREQGHRPPYWTLVEMAREVAASL